MIKQGRPRCARKSAMAVKPTRSSRQPAISTEATPDVSANIPTSIPDTSEVVEVPMDKDMNHFRVRYINIPAIKKAGRKRRASGTELIKQVADKNLFDDEHFNLDSVVDPLKMWTKMKPFKSFMIGSARFTIRQTVFINRDRTIATGVDTADLPPTAFWLAEISEIRAANSANVYAKVHWFYWPDELPTGRKWYHGKNELIRSNHAQVIDAKTVSGKADVFAWGGAEPEMVGKWGKDGIWWRGKYHVVADKAQEPRNYCICNRPINPDHLNILCTNPDCKTWLHEECVREAALEATYIREVVGLASQDNTTPNGKTGGAEANSGSPTLSRDGTTRDAVAETSTKNTSNKIGGEANGCIRVIPDSQDTAMDSIEQPWTGLFDAQVKYGIGEEPRVSIWDLRQVKAVTTKQGGQSKKSPRETLFVQEDSEAETDDSHSAQAGEDSGEAQNVFRCDEKWKRIVCLVCGVEIEKTKKVTAAPQVDNAEIGDEDGEHEVNDEAEVDLEAEKDTKVVESHTKRG